VSRPTIRARARSREDRAGDPLDGLVNLFDLGIVLSLAFLLASLSSLDLTDDLISRNRPAGRGAQTAPADAVLAGRDDEVRTVEVRPGQKVVGRGEVVGPLYRLDDGRTVIVPSSADQAGAGAADPAGAGAAEPGGATTTP
jgi:hypothetical protein